MRNVIHTTKDNGDSFVDYEFTCSKGAGDSCHIKPEHYYLAIHPGDLDVSAFCGEHNYPAAGIEITYIQAVYVMMFLEK